MDRQFTKNGFFKAVVAKVNGEAVDEMWTDEALVEFAEGEIAKLAEANAKAAEKRAAKAAENDGIKEEILALLADGELTASEVGLAKEISTQKASAMLRQLETAGLVVSREVKRDKRKAKAYKLVG